MPPKPFKPPRPSTTGSATRGRPKGSTNSTRKSISNTTPSAGMKSKPGPKGSRTSTSASRSMPKAKPRISTASLDIPGLGSISPNTSDAETRSEEEEEEEGEDDDPFSHSLPERKTKSRGDVDADMDVETDAFEDREERIPEELLTRLLHEFFKEEGTRISRDANRAVGRYMETFVRETLARAAYASEQSEEGGMLEVEDLEKLAPQILMDF